MNKLLIIVLITVTTACSQGQQMELQPYSLTQAMIGTVVTITVYADSSQKAHIVINEAFEEIGRLSKLLGPTPGSDVSRINESPPGKPVQVSSDCLQVLQIAQQVAKQSGGAFDITFASAGNLYNFSQNDFVPPQKEHIKQALESVGYNRIKLNSAMGTVTRNNENTKIGLGGVAKGYIIGKAIDLLKNSGITSALVDGGGDIVVLGTKNGSPWVTGLRHPRENNQLLFSFPIRTGKTCVTSGDYERFAYDKNGKRYHHIIDPRTGYPARNFISVTVIGDDSATSDAYATAFFVMSLKGVKSILKEQPDLQVILIDAQMNVFMSETLRSVVKLIDSDLAISSL
ncbi:MAG: FAD:protein FMN transferase [Spirochaetes bacterium]|jgi:thiamine biosynthesis lipoprotein|nr:FAD:protein FMN transferase [Spirochaetota bacterium]